MYLNGDRWEPKKVVEGTIWDAKSHVVGGTKPLGSTYYTHTGGNSSFGVVGGHGSVSSDD